MTHLIRFGNGGQHLFMEIVVKTHKPKTVFVRKYFRFRLGRLEQVCKHYRRAPA